jgi:hypothetical protein
MLSDNLYILSFFTGGAVSFCICQNMDKLEILDEKLRELTRNFLNMYNHLYEKEQNSTSSLYKHFQVVKKLVTFTGQLCLIKGEQYFRNNCSKNGPVYVLTHCIEGKLYKVVIKPKRGPIDEDYNPYVSGYEAVVDPKEYDLN